MNEEPPEIDEMTVDLVCWRNWYDGPLDGLAEWSAATRWFAHSNTWEEGGTWGYDYVLYELDEGSLREALDWFREKERWYFNPELQALRAIADTQLRAKLIVEGGLSLRDWKGPDLSTRPQLAWFRHARNRGWYPIHCRDRWRLPEGWSASTG